MSHLNHRLVKFPDHKIKPEEKGQLGRPRNKKENNTKSLLKK
jgi:hypothetical protein